MIRKGISTFFIFISCLTSYAQIGGRQTYAFLNLTNSPRIAALGGKNVSIADSSDLSLPFHNPSLLREGMHHRVVLNYVNYFSDINYGYFSLAGRYKENQPVAFGIHYMNYGRFTEANSSGVKTGTFSAADYAFNLFYSRELNKYWRAGINVKPILSVYEVYTSVGLVFDLGTTYFNPDKLFSAGLVLRNIGSQIKPYYEGNYEPVQFEIVAGFTQKLRYAPFAFSVTAHQLQKPDLTYTIEDPAEDNSLVEDEERSKIDKLGDHVMRHIILGVEFNPTRNFYVRAGYNYQRRKEMTIASKTGMVGFSFGFGIKISRFNIEYGRAAYH
ncbi:MAG TPA: type IX secretion system protein PorQ, partial [Bacteroidales bacterium]|nr:type IX secretion system protein PorQ [Bacteroidales bacterium]